MKQHAHTHIHAQGFTLIEIAIVMVVIGILMGGGVSLMRILTERKARNETVDYLKQAKDAVLSFTAINGRLPRPDTNGDGQEDACGTPCSGGLPYLDLGMTPNDPYQRGLRYELNPLLATNLSGTCNALSAGLSGNPLVADGSASVIPVSAILISAGPMDADSDGNVFDDIAGQGNNTTGNPNYVRSPPLDGDFDDLVLYINEGDVFQTADCTEVLRTVTITVTNNSGATVYLIDTTAGGVCIGGIPTTITKSFPMEKGHSIDIQDNYSGGSHITTTTPNPLTTSPMTTDRTFAVP